jgi:hypothetical protein
MSDSDMDLSKSEEMVDIKQDESSDDNKGKTKIKAADEQSETAEDEKFHKLLGVVNSRAWSWFMVLIVVISLFLQDVSLLAFPVEADGYITGIYIAIGLFFLFEFIVLCKYQEGYLYGYSELDDVPETGDPKAPTFSLFFWTDVVALLSIIPDLIPLSVLDDSSSEGTTNTLDLVIAGIRVLRLFRLWRIFRVLKLMDVYSLKQHTYAHKLGKHLSTYISMKVGCIVILITAAYVMIDYDTPYNGPYLGLEILERLPLYSASFNSTMAILTESYPVIAVVMYNKTVFTNGDDLLEERGFEIEEFTSAQGSKLYMDINEVIKGQSALNITLILFVLVFFIFITCIVKKDVKKKAIKPMHDVTDRILQVGTAMGLYKPRHLEDMYKSPSKFFNELLSKIQNRVESK